MIRHPYPNANNRADTRSLPRPWVRRLPWYLSQPILLAIGLAILVITLDFMKGGLIDGYFVHADRETHVLRVQSAVIYAPIEETILIALIATVVALGSYIDAYLRALLGKKRFGIYEFRFGNMSVVTVIVFSTLFGFLAHFGWHNPAGAAVFGLSAYLIVRRRTLFGIVKGGIQAWLMHMVYNGIIVLTWTKVGIVPIT